MANISNVLELERKMQPARGRFARSDLDRQMASTFPCPLESGPSSRFWGQPATGTRRVAGTTHTESGRRGEQPRPQNRKIPPPP